MALIYLKSILRGTIKGVASSVLGAASEEAGGEAGLVLLLLSVGTQVGAELTERADLRISRYFPAKAWVGGINLSPGDYAVTVNYHNAQGRVIASFNNQLNVRPGRLNLMETVCTR
jgi:hypothetical protein